MLWYFVSLDITNCFTHQQYKVQRKTEVYQRRRTLQGERMKHQQEEKRLARCWWFGTLHKLRERNELKQNHLRSQNAPIMIYTVECCLIATLLLHLPRYYQWFIYSALNKIEKSSKSLSYLLFSEHTYRHLTVSGQQKSYNYTVL